MNTKNTRLYHFLHCPHFRPLGRRSHNFFKRRRGNLNTKCGKPMSQPRNNANLQQLASAEDIEAGNGIDNIGGVSISHQKPPNRWAKHYKVLKSLLFLFGSCIVTYYSVILLSMFGDIALKISSEFQQEGNLAITPLSFKVHQEKAYTDYMAKKEVGQCLRRHHSKCAYLFMRINYLTFF